MAHYTFEPFKIKSIEPIQLTTREQREGFLEDAGHNIFLLRAEDVTIDLLTDSGTGAMSDNQWAGMMQGDESYAGSKNFFHLREVVRDIFGFEHFVPTHQGRGAEQVLFNILVRPGMIVPNNTHFDTTRANVEAQGGIACDLVIPEGRDPACVHPFKGNLHVAHLAKLIEREGVEKIPLAIMTVTNNAVGGQPVSMANMRETKALLARHGIPLFVDAARYAENSYFIQQREEGYCGKSVKEIARQFFSFADGFMMSAKKDGLVNIGGLLATRDPALFEKIQNRLILTEGFSTYGGLARRDLEAMARGLSEALDEKYLAYRTGQVRYLAERLAERGIPMVVPPGGHAVFINAKEFLPQLPQAQFPSQALTLALYVEGGIRAVEIGGVMFARRENGRVVYPDLELVRLAIPRRVYTQSHLDYVAEVIAQLHQHRERIRGVRIVHEAPLLRHFTARFEML